MEEKSCSAYRSFRVEAYRSKYQDALLFGGKSITFGALLVRAEYAYNSFCQMGIEPGEKVALWLPDCPDLLASFYGLSRLGAVGVLIHPVCSPKEVRHQMLATEARVLITTAGRYELYRSAIGPLPQDSLILCRPELDMKGDEKRTYLEKEWPAQAEGQRAVLDRLMAENTYNAMQTPAGDARQAAVILFGSSGFSTLRPITYLPEELEQVSQDFWQGKEGAEKVYIQNSFATEGGFLAAHGALCAGKTVIWSVGDPWAVLKKKRPDFLVGTEGFFWDFRQKAPSIKRWKNLQGGIQIGRELTAIMEKFTSRTITQCGGEGSLSGCPVPLKMDEETLCYIGDFGVRLQDLEQELCRLPGISACKALEEDGGIRVKLVPSGKEPIGKLAKSIRACCRWEMNLRHLPKKVEFCTSI